MTYETALAGPSLIQDIDAKLTRTILLTIHHRVQHHSNLQPRGA